VIVATVLGSTVAMLSWILVFLFLVIESQTAKRQTSAEMHRFLLDQTVVAMFVAEGNRLTYVNKAFAALFGYSAEKIVDEMTLETLTTVDERPRLRQALARFQSGEVGETYPHYRAVRADGSEFFVVGQVRVLPGQSDQGQVIVGMLEDTTAQHEARERARQAHEMLEQTVAVRTAELQREAKTRSDAEGAALIFRSAIEQVDAAVMLADQDHRVIHANGACQQLVQQAYGHPVHMEGCTLDPSEPLQGAIVAAMSGQKLPWTGEVSLEDGLTLALTVSALRADSGRTTHVVMVASDITERVQVNQKMAEAKLAAEQSSRAKSEFLANMSHELRTPLNAILGFSEMISHEILGPVGNPAYRDYANDIHGSAAHLLGVINDVLDIAAVEQGSLTLHEEWGSLCNVIEGSLRLVAPRAEGLTLSWTRNPHRRPLEIYADLRRLKQILLNLLSNAVKFTPAGGQVGIEVNTLEDGGVSITVYDSGIGMSAEGVQAAMQRFGQVDSSLARRWEGTGLGLPLASELAEMHDAKLGVSSEPGMGTRISITIPSHRCRWSDAKLSA
jgi:PAS domain S-box-containing protein